MSVLCKLMGHRFQNTLIIRERDDSYEIEDAHYCRQCGAVQQSSLTS